MRLDHMAYRLPQGKRDEAAQFFINAFGYKFQAEFEIYFNDEKTDKALCVALEPPEKHPHWVEHWKHPIPWTSQYIADGDGGGCSVEMHLAPEIFISEGTPGSIVHDWVQSRGGFGGLHHQAYQVDDVEAKMVEWTKNGWANFTSSKPMTCPGLTQVFSRPNCTGVIYEFIKREGHGFCRDSVKALMQSSRGD